MTISNSLVSFVQAIFVPIFNAQNKKKEHKKLAMTTQKDCMKHEEEEEKKQNHERHKSPKTNEDTFNECVNE